MLTGPVYACSPTHPIQAHTALTAGQHDPSPDGRENGTTRMTPPGERAMIRMKDRRRAHPALVNRPGRHAVGPLLHGRGGRPACRRCPGG